MTWRSLGAEVRGLPTDLPFDVSAAAALAEVDVDVDRVDPGHGNSWDESATGFTVGLEGYGEFEVTTDGARAHVHARSAAPAAEATFAVMLAVLPLTLPYLGIEPLHGCAVMTPSGRAVCILGESGAGKSTTLAALVGLGCTMLADDVCAFAEPCVLLPAAPVARVRQPPAGLDVLGEYAGKSVVRMGDAVAAPVEVAATVVLSSGDSDELSTLRREAALTALLGNCRMPDVATGRRMRPQLDVVAALAQRPVARLVVDRSTQRPPQVAERILDWASGAG